MNPLTLIKIAYGLLRLVNWITRQIDQHQWEASGFRKAAEAELVGINQEIGFAVKEREDAHNLSPEDRRRRLEDAV